MSQSVEFLPLSDASVERIISEMAYVRQEVMKRYLIPPHVFNGKPRWWRKPGHDWGW